MALIWSAAAPPGVRGGGRGLVQGGLVCAICHPAPAWHGALRGGRDTDCLAGLEWKGGEWERGEEEGGGITEGPQEPPPLPIISEMIHILG